MEEKRPVEKKEDEIESVTEKLKEMYLRDVIPLLGSDGQSSDRKKFASHILLDPSISGDEAKTKLLAGLFKKTKYSAGVTTLIESLGSDVISKPNWAYVDGYTSVRTFSLEPIEGVNSYVNPKYAKKHPAARGKVLHHMIQTLIMREYSCYSPIPIERLPEASDRASDIPSTLEKLAAEIQLAGFRFVALEFPVYYRRTPVLKPVESAWRWLIGRIDMIAWHEKHGLCLMDLKFSEVGGVRRRHALQLSLLALCLASMGIWVDSLFVVSIKLARNEYNCNIYMVTFAEGLVSATIAENAKIKASFRPEDLITFRSLSSALITELSAHIPTSKKLIVERYNLREKAKKDTKQEESAP